MDLQEIRGKLDQIDRQFVELLEERLDLCGQVAADKIKTGKAVFDKEREQQKLASVRAMAGNEFNARAAEELFTQLMTISRRLQYQIIEEHGKKIETGFTMVDSLKKDQIKVVYQGVEGAYSHAAAMQYFGDDVDAYHVKTWEDAMDDVESGKADYAVIPIENSSAGAVVDNYDLLIKHHIVIVAETCVAVDHALLGLPKAELTDVESLQELVLREHLDAGFAFDGDADRCLCVDEKGNVITGDHILYIYGCYMKERGKLVDNKVVTTVMSNFGLYKAFDAVGIDYEKTKVGDKYVYECMSKNGYRLGGEQSGHIIFSKYATTGDGIITALKMMEVMLAKKKPLSQLAEPLAIYPQVLKNVRVTDKTQAQNDADVRAMVERAAKELGTDGRILVRESGTEPLVRVMVEAGNVETCEKYVDAVIDVIRSKGYVIE